MLFLLKYKLLHPVIHYSRHTSHRRTKMRKWGIRGKINFGCLTLTLLLIAGGYVGYKFGRVYLGQYMFDRKVFEITGDVAEDWKAKLFPSDGDIVEALLTEARKHGVGITPDDIEIDRDAKKGYYQYNLGG